MAKHSKELTGMDNLCFAGGVALNSVANGKLICEKVFRNIFIQPAAGDAGGALGAALAVNHIYFGRERITFNPDKDAMRGAFLGPEYSNIEILKTIRKYKAYCNQYPVEERNKLIVDFLQEGKVVGRFQGRMEFGPRALGNRSILASPLFPDMQRKLNLKIKFREGFRPFAAVTTEEDGRIYFNYEKASPYMLFVYPLKESFRNALPSDYNNFPMDKKLEMVKSTFPGITHVDFSCRIQTTTQKDNPALWQLLNDFKTATGYALLINTSFNIRGEPIVCTPDQAYAAFMRTGMDVLVMNNFIFLKEEQPKWEEVENINKFTSQD